jgi:localization factor PodJL
MKPGVPWSVKGIEPDAREAAKHAARRSGMTLGEWLNSKILDASDDIPDMVPSAVRARPVAAPRSDALERTANRLEDIAEQLSRLSRRDTDSAMAAAAPRAPADNETFTRILSRVESNERQTVEAFTAVNDRLSVLGRQITQSTRARDTRPEDHPGYQALEKAVRGIVEHVETAEKRNRDNFKSLQDRMTAMSQKAAAAPQEAISKQAPAFTQLEARLADLAKRVESSETATQRNPLPELLKTELTELANRIDTVRDTAESLASRAQTQAVQASQQELRAIESRIIGLIKEAQSSLVGQTTSPAEMQRLRGEVERLNARIDEASRGQASGGDVSALRAAVEQLSTRVAQGPDMRPIQEMDRRILDITQRLEQTQAQTRQLPQFSELERRMAELDHKLNEASLSRNHVQTSDIEDRLNDIASRVGRTEQQLASLETIERAVNQLFDSVEQQRNWTQEVATAAADSAATRMAQTILAQTPEPFSLSSQPEIQALHDGISAVRAASEAAEGRNQETLEAVHETLEHIVTKLSELETAAIGQRVAQAVASPAVTVQLPEQFVQAQAPALNPFDQPAVAVDNSWTAMNEAPAQNPFDAVTSVEPLAPAGNPFDAIIQQQSNPLAGVEAEAPVESDDFIAAARRAAQAAVQPKSMLSGISPGAARVSEKTSKKLLSLDMFSKKQKKVEAKSAPGLQIGSEIKPPPGFKAAANNNTAKRKYIIMGIALLAAASIFTFGLLGKTQKIKAVAEPTKLEQQLGQEPAAAPQAVEPNATTRSIATPEAPKPAQVESSLDSDGLDPILTGSVGQADEGNLTSLIAVDSDNPNMPPKEAGVLKLREAAAMGNADAQFVIGTRYLNGEGGAPQDDAKAAYWYGKAAAGGNAPAQYRLGTLYERGKGVAKDINAALGWYERSAALGNVKAMHNAAVLSASNDQRQPDFARAFKWFSLAAAHGQKDSQYNLAVLLERGLGTQKNAKEALFWYSIAAKQSDADAAKRADALAKTIGSNDLTETEKRLRLWQPEVAPDRANTVAVDNAAWEVTGKPAG